MVAADWINAIGLIALPVILIVWGVFQWKSDRNLQNRQRREELSRHAEKEADEARRQARRRDSHLTDWGLNVISLMAELEGHCRPELRPNSLVADVAWRASSLVDQGRLFFPNVPTMRDRHGYRPKILDEVVRATYVARRLGSSDTIDTERLRKHIYASRRRFIYELQKKIKPTLYEANFDDQGLSIPHDPLEWEDKLFEMYPSR